MTAPREARPRPGRSGTFTVATWNIRSGRNGGLESAARALESLGVDIAVLQETKLTGKKHTRFTSGYHIIASEAESAQKGGIALAWRENHEVFEVEATRVVHANVITLQLVTGDDRYYVVGCYC